MARLFPFLLAAACHGADPVDTTDTGEVGDPYICGPTHAWEEAGEAYDDLRARFDEHFAASGLQGAAVALMKDGVIVFAHAAGERDPRVGAPMTVRTRARNASTLKMQTATALLHQGDLGRLSLDDTVPDWVPGLDLSRSPGHMDDVTLYHLLTHQGGFFDALPLQTTGDTVSALDTVYGSFARDNYALAPAGSFWNYSNPNYALAGLIASAAAHTDYQSLMQRAVWRPLCMSRATFDPAAVEDDGDWATAAFSDAWLGGAGDEVWATPTSFGNAFSRPAGLAWMSVLDLLHFQHFLLQGDDAVLSDAAREALLTPWVATPELGSTLGYGYGVFVADGFSTGEAWYDATLWVHSGYVPGYTTFVATLPEEGVSVALMQLGEEGSLTAAFYDVLLSTTDLAPTTPPEVPYDPAVLDAAVGTYADPFNVGTLRITRAGDTLHVEALRLDDLEIAYRDTLEWLGDANFTWTIDGTPYPITFVDDDDPADGYRWFADRVFVAERRDPNTRAATPSRPLRLAPAPRTPPLFP